MARWDPVGSIRRPSDSGSSYAEITEFIRCVDGQEPQIHEVWTLGSKGFMYKVHLTAKVDVNAGVVGEFSSVYLTESGRTIPLNGSVEHLGIPDFHGIGRPFWADNPLAPGPSWVEGSTTINQNWVSHPGVTCGSVAVLWSCPVSVCPAFFRRSS